MVAGREGAGLGRQHVERRDAQVLEAVDRPDVAAVGVAVARRRARRGRGCASAARRRRARAPRRVSSTDDGRAERRRAPAAPTAAYWRRISSIAFADHGSSSQSSTSQPVSSASHSPARSTAARSRSSAGSASSRNGRPGARVERAACPRTPKRSRATSSSRQTTAIAREPMCFSSHTTCATPAARYSANASAGCSSASGARRGRGRRHRRRQVDEPARVDREAAHDLQRARRVLLARSSRCAPGASGRSACPRRRRCRAGTPGAPRATGRNGRAGA